METPVPHRVGTGSTRFWFQCTPELRDRLQSEAARQGLSGASWVRMTLKRHLDALDAKRGNA